VDPDHLIELFAGFGPVSVRRMFSGFGVYADGIMFALAARDVVYLKADDASSAAFAREGQGPFTYQAKGGNKGGKRVIMSYWRLPDRLYDDPDELADWARIALAVARRAKAPKPRKRPQAKRKPTRKSKPKLKSKR
jgi:DNA transformation protein and related proteins